MATAKRLMRPRERRRGARSTRSCWPWLQAVRSHDLRPPSDNGVLVNDVEARWSFRAVPPDLVAVTLETLRAHHGWQLGAAQALDGEPCRDNAVEDRQLVTNALVLGEERPTLFEAILDPLIVAGELTIGGKDVGHEVNPPACRDQGSGGALAQAAIDEELRLRLE